MIKKLSALIETRKLMALSVTFCFISLSFMGVLQVDFIQAVIISVISYYFGTTNKINEKGD